LEFSELICKEKKDSVPPSFCYSHPRLKVECQPEFVTVSNLYKSKIDQRGLCTMGRHLPNG